MTTPRICGCGDSGHTPESWCVGCNQCVDCCFTSPCSEFTPPNRYRDIENPCGCGAEDCPRCAFDVGLETGLNLGASLPIWTNTAKLLPVNLPRVLPGQYP